MDDRIRKTLNNKIYEPNDLEYMIKNTINREYDKKTKKNKIIKSFTTVFACLVIVSTVAFADNAAEIIKKWFGISNGVEEAINNGYIEQIPKEYTESKDAKIKVTDFVMDDMNLNISLNGKFNETIDSSKLMRLKFININIKDEENNIIFSQNDTTNINEKEILKNDNDDTEKLNSSSYSTYINTINSNSIDFLININANDLPKSKTLKIQIEDISLSSENYDREIRLKGVWNIDIEVPEKFYNRTSIKYNVVECNNKYVDKNSINAIVYNTGMKFSVEMEINDGIKETMNQYNGTGNIEENLSIKNNAYIENENGEKFYISAISDGDGGYGIEDNRFKYWQTFNITKYNLTEKLKVVLETGKGDIITINLEK